MWVSPGKCKKQNSTSNTHIQTQANKMGTTKEIVELCLYTKRAQELPVNGHLRDAFIR